MVLEREVGRFLDGGARRASTDAAGGARTAGAGVERAARLMIEEVSNGPAALERDPVADYPLDAEDIDDLTGAFDPRRAPPPGRDLFPEFAAAPMPRVALRRADAVAVGLRVPAPPLDAADRALRLAAFALERDVEVVILAASDLSGFERFGFRSNACPPPPRPAPPPGRIRSAASGTSTSSSDGCTPRRGPDRSLRRGVDAGRNRIQRDAGVEDRHGRAGSAGFGNRRHSGRAGAPLGYQARVARRGRSPASAFAPRVAPVVEIALHGRERREVLGRHAPLAAAAGHVQNGVDEFAQTGGAASLPAALERTAARSTPTPRGSNRLDSAAPPACLLAGDVSPGHVIPPSRSQPKEDHSHLIPTALPD